jgi:hypothetical protein
MINVSSTEALATAKYTDTLNASLLGITNLDPAHVSVDNSEQH